MIAVIAFVVVFSAVVLVHELGHYLAARKAGVKVYEFSIGFPFSPRIATLFRYRETEFTVRLLPLGGFVSFSRDGDEDAAELFGASRFHRFQILSAGSLFNIIFAFLAITIVLVLGKDQTPGAAIIASAKTLWATVSGTVEYLVAVLTGHGSLEGLSGPVGIAMVAGKAAARGFMNLLYFTGMLSLSLGIMNLFPLPALDGGQLLMLLIETVRNKPLGLRTYQVVNAIGMVIFLALTVLITYRDIMKLAA